MSGLALAHPLAIPTAFGPANRAEGAALRAFDGAAEVSVALRKRQELERAEIARILAGETDLWPVPLPAMLLIWMPLVVFTVAVSLVLAAASVFLRDLQHTVGLLLNVLFFLTPVFYPETLIPEKLRFMLYINPMAYVAVHSRRIAVLGVWPDLARLALFTALCLLLLWFAASWFASVRRRFADVL